MFSWIAARLRCSRGVHERSERHITRTREGGHVSVCRYCRARMKRRAKRDWQVISREEFEALTTPPPHAGGPLKDRKTEGAGGVA
jgi:hypothetical protein